MLRMLLLNGEVTASDQELRRRLLRFTGSRRATRAILARIDAARSLGRIVGCMVRPILPGSESARDTDMGWEVGVTYAGRLEDHQPAMQ